jgi:predicted CoA-binding protein
VINPDDDVVRRLLTGARRIAVVGLSPKPHRDSHRVARYLIDQGYEVIPVYPREDTILGQPVFRQVRDITGGVDLVDVFRRSEQLPEVVEDALLGRVPALWFQLGCVHDAAARRAAESGAIVVMDRCLMVEHERLLGR